MRIVLGVRGAETGSQTACSRCRTGFEAAYYASVADAQESPVSLSADRMHALPAPEVTRFVSNGSAFCARFSFPQELNAWRSAGEAISKRTYFVASAAYILWSCTG